MKFVQPKKIKHTKGYLIMESDDNNAGDYSHWYPLFKLYNKRCSQFIDIKNVRKIRGCLNINSGTLGSENKITIDNLVEMYNDLFDVHVHNRYHIGIGKIKLSQIANIGDTKLYLESVNNNGFNHLVTYNYYTYKLFNTTDEEVVNIVSYNSNENSITISMPLTKCFDVGSYFSITDNSRKDLIGECKNDLLNLGINAKHYTFTYHSGSEYYFNQDAIDYAHSIFLTSRGRYGNTNDISNIEWENLNSMAIRSSTTKKQIDEQLDLTYKNNLI